MKKWVPALRLSSLYTSPGAQSASERRSASARLKHARAPTYDKALNVLRKGRSELPAREACCLPALARGVHLVLVSVWLVALEL